MWLSNMENVPFKLFPELGIKQGSFILSPIKIEYLLVYKAVIILALSH